MPNARVGWQKKFRITCISTVIVVLFILNTGVADDVIYKIEARPDGGYSLKMDVTKTTIFSADGFSRKVRNHFEIVLLGKGEDWSYRNQKGFYYRQNDVVSSSQCWDFGYAWVDADRTYLYLNLYWVSSPESMIPSDLNGKYRLNRDE
jgi:hypothetical protein